MGIKSKTAARRDEIYKKQADVVLHDRHYGCHADSGTGA